MLTVDASVWVAAADRSDGSCTASREFLSALAQRRLQAVLPSFAWVEIACALARRCRDAKVGRRLAAGLLTSPLIVRVDLGGALLGHAVECGTALGLRGADALYAATAALHGTQLVAWDAELVDRAGALTPPAWLAANP
jgi:predicted nucleic acid-binding protein